MVGSAWRCTLSMVVAGIDPGHGMNRVDVIDRPAPLIQSLPAEQQNADGQILVPMNDNQRWEAVARLAEQLSLPTSSS